ncbi:glycosyltransferase family 25 protein [Campylobacter lari]|uniref:Glycosyltransferase family 25 protein n=1 Tax=Campylobacter lari TaxID=201 RepID=A0A5L8LMP3_CAMLA|nr:glycosyltransferase family 25 protein [Campylobacter lari]EAK9939898.1 glycosyltransferase family 25 protein [Campylobacter lari]MCR2068158.1 glycosyltransferase family 25 protein [Campylobacter lari subsp. concheus]
MEKVKVFIINLERSEDRKNFMQEQIQKLFTCNPNLKDLLEFEFFRAIDGSKNEHLKFKSHSPWWCQLVLGRELSDSEKSCFASHYSLWKKCQELNSPIIILEDDIIFSDELLNNSNIIEKLLNSNYEYIRLHYSFDKKIYQINNNFFKSFENISSTLGYFLHPSAAIKFTNKAKYWFKPVDDYMDMYYYNKIQNIIYKPFLLNLNHVETTITQRKKKLNIPSKIIRKITRFYFLTLRFIFTKKYH